MKVVLAAINAKYIHSSLAVRYLKAYCKDEFPEIQLKEYSINNNVMEMLSDLFQTQPDVLGMPCYIWNIDMVFELAALVKKVMPQTVIVVGGPEVSYDAGDILQKYAAVDFVIQGEGELAFKRTLQSIRAGVLANDSSKAVAGLAYRRAGEIINDHSVQTIKDLDSIPFPYDEADMEYLRNKIIYYESSRGCPFSCQYCLSSATTGVRFFALERVYRDLEFFIHHKVRQVKFIDRTFNAAKTHYWSLWQFLAQQDCETNFHFEIAADLLDDEVLNFLEHVPIGRFQFEIGVQSTNNKTLAAICRRNDWSRIAANVQRLKQFGNIHVHLDLIAGLPYEDYASFGSSFNDVYGLGPDMLQLGFLKLLKGSGIRENAVEHEYLYADKAPYQVLANRYMTYTEIRHLHQIEELVDLLYNSGKFKTFLLYMVRQYRDAFAFYDKLAVYWENQGFYQVAHSTKALHANLGSFCRDTHPEWLLICAELLKWDALSNERGAVLPEFLPWNGSDWEQEKNQLWRDEATMQKYCPQYRFTTWRDVKKNYPIEVFSVDILSYLNLHGTGQLQFLETPVIFSYYLGGAKAFAIESGDFVK